MTIDPKLLGGVGRFIERVGLGGALALVLLVGSWRVADWAMRVGSRLAGEHITFLHRTAASGETTARAIVELAHGQEQMRALLARER